MRLYSTVNDIQSEIEVLYRNITGRNSFTAGERDIVYGCIIDAFLIVLLEYGIDNFKFREVDIEEDTTSGTNYIDLDEYIYKIIPGSVRIPASNSTLGIIDEVEIFQIDPNDEASGEPYAYSYKSSTDPNIMRLRLYPTPNAVFTLAMKVLKFPTDVATNFPIHLMNVIKAKAKALACMHLGVIQYKLAFDEEYKAAIINIRNGFDNDQPKHINRTYRTSVHRSINSRIND